MPVTTDEPIFNYSIIKSAIKLMNGARCSDIPCLYCALYVNDTCIQSTLNDHLRVLDAEKVGDDS